jgi:hypothetical protein
VLRRYCEGCPSSIFIISGNVERTSLAPGEDEGSCTLTLEVQYTAVGPACLIEVVFENVKRARLPELSPSFYFSELEVHDVSRDQLEGIGYRVRDQGMTEFEVFCQGIWIGVVAPTDEDAAG